MNVKRKSLTVYKKTKQNALESTDKYVSLNKIFIDLVWVRRFPKVEKIIKIQVPTFRLLQVSASPIKKLKFENKNNVL